jgi:hypothetical protein
VQRKDVGVVGCYLVDTVELQPCMHSTNVQLTSGEGQVQTPAGAAAAAAAAASAGRLNNGAQQRLAGLEDF